MHKDSLVFASKSMTQHILRGMAGFLAIVFSAVLLDTLPWVSIALIAIAFLAFRGCPVCWSIGIFQTSCKIKDTSQKNIDG
jgi:hypothetical protein